MTNGTYEQYLVDADGAVQQGDWQVAIQALKQADTLQPGQPPILTALGSCHIQLGQMDAAVDYFQKVAGLASNVFEAHNNLGVALTLAGQYAGAEKALPARAGDRWGQPGCLEEPGSGLPAAE